MPTTIPTTTGTATKMAGLAGKTASKVMMIKGGETSTRRKSCRRRHCSSSHGPLRWLVMIGAMVDLVPIVVDAAPLWLLMNGMPKCLQMTGIEHMTYRIEYTAPDLEDEMPAKDSKNVGSNAAHAYFEHHRAQFQQQGTMRAPIVLRIMHLGGPLKTAKGQWSRPSSYSYQNRKTESHEVRTPQGSYAFRAEKDGAIEICASSVLARPQQPMPIHLHVLEDFRIEARNKNLAQAEEKEKEIQEGQKVAERTLSVLEASSKHLIKQVDLLIGNADYAQNQEKEFHDQTVKMHSATKLWPIGQLVILLVTGVAQVVLIGRSFQKTFR